MDGEHGKDRKSGVPREFYDSQAEIIEDEELSAQTLPMAGLKDALEHLKTQFELSASGGPFLSFTEDGRKTVMDWVEIVKDRIKTANISDALARKIEGYLKEVEKYAKKKLGH